MFPFQSHRSGTSVWRAIMAGGCMGCVPLSLSFFCFSCILSSSILSPTLRYRATACPAPHSPASLFFCRPPLQPPLPRIHTHPSGHRLMGLRHLRAGPPPRPPRTLRLFGARPRIRIRIRLRLRGARDAHARAHNPHGTPRMARAAPAVWARGAELAAARGYGAWDVCVW